MTKVNEREELNEALGAIGYHLYNLKNVKTPMGRSYY